MRALLLLLALTGPAAAQDRCVVACDVVTTGADAAARAEAALGVVLPEGARVVGLVEGGFQDAFVQARLEVARTAMDATIKRLGIGRRAAQPRPAADLGPPGPDWWEDARQEDLWLFEATLPGFAYATVGLGPSRDGPGYTLLLWAFQT